ncbi:MAG TPA: hypothetical protein DCL54_07325 [Alphaproteobacteria bacterium]|nr:hypothetical protein [Alphaproteobacteria bacterium]
MLRTPKWGARDKGGAPFAAAGSLSFVTEHDHEPLKSGSTASLAFEMIELKTNSNDVGTHER